MSKKCAQCDLNLPLSKFYSKGRRKDNLCKNCRKKKRSTTYVSQKNQDEYYRLLKFFDLLFDSKIKRIEELNSELDKIINNQKYKIAS